MGIKFIFNRCMLNFIHWLIVVFLGKLGRTTNDRCIQYTVLFPESISKDIQPLGMESRSKRITYLVKEGLKHQKDCVHI